MKNQPERFWYPFTATTVIARKIVPLMLFTLGIGLFALAGREFYTWQRPWAVFPSAGLGLLAWLAAIYFFTLLPEIRASDTGLSVRRWGLFWRHIPWISVASVHETARIDLLGWVESFYTVYVWREVRGRKGHVRRDWHVKQGNALRFSGHIRNSERLLNLIRERATSEPLELEFSATENDAR